MPKVEQRTRADGRVSYFVRVRSGTKRYSSETFDSRPAAAAFAKRVERIGGPAAVAERNRRDRNQVDDYVPTLAEWLPIHIKQLTGVTDRTRLDYQRLAERTFLPHLGDLGVDGISRAEIADWVNAMSRKGAADKSVANAHALLSGTLASAVDAGHLSINPSHGMRLPRTHREHAREERFLTREEYGRLLEHTREHYRPLVALLFGSGLRWSEATALRVRDVTPGPPARVRVARAWKTTPGQPLTIGVPKSEKSRRNAVLAIDAFELVAPLLVGRDPNDLLFTGTRGAVVHHGPFRDRVWVPAARAAGLASPSGPYDGPRIHDARHSHASWLISTGQVTIEMVQDQLGHESMQTTRKIYGHLMPETQNRLAEALASLSRPTLLPA